MPHPIADTSPGQDTLLLPGHPLAARHPIATARRQWATLCKQRMAEYEPLPVEPAEAPRRHRLRDD